MSIDKTDKLDLQSPDLVNDNFEKLAALFPNCVTEAAEGKAIDFDLLKQELNHSVVEGTKERYRLEWPGKREAIVTANLPTNKTLRPVREDSVDFDNTENIYIEGDNLEVLKLLQESYLGKIKMIYIDPPYNTGNDFIYKDNFTQDSQGYKSDSGYKDDYNRRLVPNPEADGRYHSNWLTMLYPRLKIARNMLCDSGIIFMSIGQDELSNLIQICDSIFGEVNRISIVGRLAKAGGNKGKFFSPNIEYLLVYAKKIEEAHAFKDEMDPELIKKVYTKIQEGGLRDGEKYRAMGLYQSSLDSRANQRYFIEMPDGSLVIPPGSELPLIKKEGEKITPKNSNDGCWRWTYETYVKERENGNIEFSKTKNKVLVNENNEPSQWNVNTKIWLKDRQEEGQLPNDLITKYENRHSAKELKELEIPFDFAKPSSLLKYLLIISEVNESDIVLDFFSGSATTADALMQLNSEDGAKRRHIQVQLPELTDKKSDAYKAGFENICELGKERIRRAGVKIQTNLSNQIIALQNELEKKTFDLEKEQTASINSPETIDQLKSEIQKIRLEIENVKANLRQLDTGFRVYRLDESNMQDVYYKPQDYEQANLDLFADNVKPDRSSDDLLAQVMLDWGLQLSLKIQQTIIGGKQVFKVAENSLYACFDKGIDEAFAKEIAKDQPLRIVFRDNGFKDDTAKTNVKQLLKQLSPETEMKVI